MVAKMKLGPIDAIRGLSDRVGNRTIAFFDAVMAIAITLLALEITVPTGGTFDADGLGSLFVPFTALFVSYVVLGEVWIIHSRVFAAGIMARVCSASDHLVLMFLVVTFPKATELIAVHPQSSYAIAVYIAFYVLLMGALIIVIMRAFIKLAKMGKKSTSALGGKPISQILRDFTAENADFASELEKVVKSGILSFIVGLASTTASAFSLFACPAACYAFSAVGLLLLYLISRRSDHARDNVIVMLSKGVDVGDDGM